MAELATGNSEDALDLVQDAMMGLVKSYSDRSEQEWQPLFYRILQSRIRDYYRRSKVRNRFRVWLGLGSKYEREEQVDPIQNIPDSYQADTIQKVLEGDTVEQLLEALQALPNRQQQAFLLRAWEGLDVAETAFAMGCSEGSVKTHYSRAIHRLRSRLEDYWP